MKEIMNLEFSGFACGYRNKKGAAVLQTIPDCVLDIPTVYKYVTSDLAKPATVLLRSMIGKATDQEISDFKKLNFRLACVRGIFIKRCSSGLATLSKFLPVDIDDLSSTEEARQVQQILIGDPALEVAMSFVSPKGKGAKVFVELPDWAVELSYSQQYEVIANHIAVAHGIPVDFQTKDIARAAFLCHDPLAYLNPKYMSDKPKQ